MRKTVEDVMTKTVVVVGDSASFKEMVELMDEFRVSALPVLDADRRVAGIVSEADLLLKEARRTRLLRGSTSPSRTKQGRRPRGEPDHEQERSEERRVGKECRSR